MVDLDTFIRLASGTCIVVCLGVGVYVGRVIADIIAGLNGR